MDRKAIEDFADIVPPYGADTHGETVRLAIVNRLMGALPGHIIEQNHIYLRQGDSWRHFFFPKFQPGPLHSVVDQLTGLEGTFWSGFSTVLMCASIYQVSHETVRMVDKSKVDQALASYNFLLQQGTALVSLYAHVLARDWAPLTNLLSNTDKATARAITLERYASRSWREQKRDQQLTFDWVNYDWDIFHYWVKLLALGADQATIDAAARGLEQHIDVPSAVSASVWARYFQWMRPPSDPLRMAEISHAEFDAEAARGILMTRTTTAPVRAGGGMPSQHQTPEGYSAHFMLPGQPGDDFRVVRRDSCLGAGSPVLLADGTTLPIEQIVPGTQVATPNGPAEVAVLVRTPRAGRPLFRLNGGTMTFTAAHPLLAAPGSRRKAGFLAVAPAQAGQTVPTLSWFGIDRLEPGAHVRAWDGKAATALAVESVTAEEATAGDETVYDVVVWPHRTSDCQYIVCNGADRLVVGAEVPLLSKAPRAMQVVLAVLARLAPLVERSVTPETLPAFETRFAEFLAIAQHEALPAALRRAGRDDTTPTIPSAKAELAATFDRLQDGATYNVVFGRVVAMLVGMFGTAVDSAIALGFRTIAPRREQAPEILALSLHDVAFRKWVRTDFEKTLDIAATLGGLPFAPAAAGLEPTDSDRPYLRRLNTVAYLRPPAAMAGTIETIKIVIAPAGRPRMFGEAVVDLTPGAPLRRYSARLADAAGTPAGRLSFDLRALTARDMRTEDAARAEWSEAAMDAFAQRLCVTLADETAILFTALNGA